MVSDTGWGYDTGWRATLGSDEDVGRGFGPGWNAADSPTTA
ncbi:hypothetical protein [Streptomyces roseolus]